MGNVLLGIDLGTTGLKTACIDARSGRLLAWAGCRLPVREASDGTREQDPALILQGLSGLARKLQREMGARWKDVAGIGIAAQGGSAILMHPGTGAAHTPIQLWNDSRPLSLLADIAASHEPAWWYDYSRLSAPAAGLARIRWLQQKHPRRFRGPVLYGGAGEFFYFHLTGCWRQDAGNAVQIGCYDVNRKKLIEEPLRLVDFALDRVAPLRQGHETHPLSAEGAALLGLGAGIPVAGPYMDHEAGYLSCANAAQRPLQCSMGTAWVGNFVASKPPASSAGLDLLLPSPVDRRFQVLRVMRAGVVTWDWGLTTLIAPDLHAALKQADAIFKESLLPPDGLAAFPWFTMPNAVDPAFSGHGGFSGLGAHTTRADLLRALAAGMAFEFHGLFQPLLKSKIIDAAVLGGGAAKGWMFQQLLAGLFAPLPVWVAEQGDTAGARGCVYAFSERAAQAPIRRVAAPRGKALERILRQQEHYQKAKQRF